MVNNVRVNTRNKIIMLLVIVLSYLMFIPMLFITFDPHHDGLILSTVRLTRQSLLTGAPLPFNQYGPAWSILDTIFTWFVPFSQLMLSLRLLTFLLYLLTGFLLFNIGRRIYSVKTGYIAVLLFVISQPFVSTYQSGFMSWPSAYAPPLLLSITHLWLKRDQNKEHESTSLLDTGIAVLAILLIFTRAQVGLLATAFLTFLYFYYLGRKALIKFLSIYSCLVSIVLCCSIVFPMFGNAINDEFIYGAMHASAELGFKIPYFSILGASGWLLGFYLLLRVKIKKFNFGTKSLILFTLVIALIGVLIFKIAEQRELSYFGLFSTLQRRFWVSLFLACMLVGLIKFRGIFKNRRFVLRNFSRYEVLIVGFSLVGYSQTYPLFDQMHSWWGSVPLVLLIANLLINTLDNMKITGLRVGSLIIAFLMVLNLGLAGASIYKPRDPLLSSQLSLIYESPEISKSFTRISSFLNREIPAGARVQNLCTDAHVFLLPKELNSSTYLTVHWNNFRDTPHMKKLLPVRMDTYIVDCLGLVASNTKYLKIDSKSLELRSIYNDLSGRKWRIYYYGKRI